MIFNTTNNEAHVSSGNIIKLEHRGGLCVILVGMMGVFDAEHG